MIPFVGSQPSVMVALLALSFAFNGAKKQTVFANGHDLAPNFWLGVVDRNHDRVDQRVCVVAGGDVFYGKQCMSKGGFLMKDIC